MTFKDMNEKFLSIGVFPFYLITAILLGSFAGALIEKLIRSMQNGSTNLVTSFGYLILQIVIISGLLYIFSIQFLPSFISLENYSTGTYFFNIAFFTVQTSLSANILRILGMS